METKSDLDLVAILRDHGLQVTYQRLAIYQALTDTKEHPSAEIIYQKVRKRFPMISLGTVYKALERFSSVGLVQRVGSVTDVARYDAMVIPHHHVVCLKCQSIHNIADSIKDQKIGLSDEWGFHIVRHQVIFEGYCSRCWQTQADADSQDP